ILVYAVLGDRLAGAPGAGGETVRQAASWAVAALALALGAGGLAVARGRIAPGFRARNQVEAAIGAALLVCSALAVLTTVGIVLSLLFESIRFFSAVSPIEFLFGVHWSPQIAIRAD